MKHLIFLILTLTILATSCDKDKNLTVISGVVVQKNTLKPIHNAELIITQSYSKGVMQGIAEWTIDTVYTDQDGRFEWKTDINPRNEHYDATGRFGIKQVKADNYFDLNYISFDSQGNGLSTQYRHKKDLYFQMTPHAYLELSLINAAVPDTDYCKFVAINTSARDEVFGETKTKKYIVPSEKQITYVWQTDMTVDTLQRDSFYLQAFETKKLEILY